MTNPTRNGRSNAAFIAAAIAGVAGLVVLVLALIRLIDLIDRAPADAPVTASTTSTVPPTTTGVAPATTTTPLDFVTLSDTSGGLSADMPAGWTDISGSAWLVEGAEVGLALSAAPDLEAWYSTWGVPGAFVGVSGDFVPGPDDFSGVCTRGNTADRTAGLLTGTVQTWSACGEEGSDFYVFSGTTIDGTGNVLIQLVSIDGSGLDTLAVIMTTLRYTP